MSEATMTPERRYLSTITAPEAAPVIEETAQGLAAVRYEYRDGGSRSGRWNGPRVYIGHANDYLAVDYGRQEAQVAATWTPVAGDRVAVDLETFDSSADSTGWRRRASSPPVETGQVRVSDIVNVDVNVTSLPESTWATATLAEYQRQIYGLITFGSPLMNRPASGADFPGARFPLAPVAEPDKAELRRVRFEAEELDARAALAAEAEDLLGYTPLRDAVKAPGRLRRALAALEIEVLDQDAVDAYKAQMVEHHRSYNKTVDPTWRITALADYALPVPEFVLRKAVAIKRALPEAQFYVDQLAVDPFLIVTLEADGLYDSLVNHSSRKLNPDTAAYVEVWSEPKFEEAL